MAQSLELIIKARDEASSKLKGVGASLAQIGAALGAVKLIWSELIEPLIKFNKEISNLHDATGTTVEDLGRLREVADDVGVNFASLSTAFEMATKNGFSPSIGSIATLADRVNAMEDPTKRAAALAKIFGKGWADLAPLLALGGDRIRDLTAAVEDSLIPTEQSIRKTEELNSRLEEWSDRIHGVGNTLALELIPQLEEGATWQQDFLDTFFGGIPVIDAYASKLRPVPDILRDVGKAAGDAGDDVGELTQRQYYQMAATALLAGDTAAAAFYQGLGNAAGAAADQVNRLVDAMMRSYGASVADADVGLMGDLGMGEPTNSGQWQPFTGYGRGVPTDTMRRWYNGRWIYQAQGGEVGTGGDAYMVGEHGAERFTPSVPGTISPTRDQLASSIDRMVKTLPTILIDAIERAK